ncbi:MAG: hypothetical protein ACFFD4_01260 [Candidatus Odinarchaeota archaeon]
MAGKCKTATKRLRLKTSGLLHTSIKVATVENGNQISLPAIIMRRAGIFNRAVIYLFMVDDAGMVGISVRPPARGRYKRIRLSNGGKFIIPRFLRDSQGITAGTNLMFLYNGSEILITRLTSKDGNQEVKEKWKSFSRKLPSFEDLPGIISHSTSKNGIEIRFKRPVNRKQVEYLVNKLEDLVGAKLLAKQESPEVIVISPIDK